MKILYPEQNTLKNYGKIKNYKIEKTEKIHSQKIYTMRNVEGSYSGRRKMIPNGNLYLHKEMKSTTNRKY